MYKQNYNNNIQKLSSFSTSGANSGQGGPTSLRCVFCKEEKPLDAFSQTQIQKATHNPYAPVSYNKKAKLISCKKCSPTQQTHLTCSICSKTQPLDKFAKSQRRNAEKARCIKCNKKREEEDVWASDPETDSDDEFDQY
ncbi:Stc1 domain-containing protein [Pilaira anomala]|nr:Stc1 domain-containing protein [Pilaira anomala]